MENGNTASFTPKCGKVFVCKFKSDSFLPIIISVATRAMEMPHTFETSGTVRDARGFASIT